MEVMTIVEGRVPASRAAEFENAYAALKKDAPVEGLVRSSLLRSSDKPDIYRIETVWESREALDRMRSSTQVPKAVELFRNVGASPHVEIYEILENVP